MIAVNSIDYDLSLKLGDPRDDTGDGQIFSRQDRLKYLSRAYGRLLRNLEKLSREYQPQFSKQIEPFDIILKTPEEKMGAKIGPLNESIRKIIEMYVYISDAEAFVDGKDTPFPVTFIEDDKYLSVKNGKNTLYLPDYKKRKFYYTLMGGAIFLLPLEGNGYTTITTVAQLDVPQLNITSVINMSNDYRDILIVMAANEGMQDLARADKVQLYTRDIQNELQILGINTQKQEKDEGRVNG